MQRTINQNLFLRLAAQAEEAELQGLTKEAAALTKQIDVYADKTRPNEGFYVYGTDEFQTDLNDQLWNAAMRVADFYGIQRLDAAYVQEMIDKTAENMKASLRRHAGIREDVGAYEPTVPGEEHAVVAFEVEE
jgi:hypothetical protein